MRNEELLPKELLAELGILDWGYTEEAVPLTYQEYELWINRGLHGPLSYLADQRKDMRSSLTHVYPDFQSALVFLFSYQSAKKWMLEENHHEVAAYTLGFGGEDYHFVLKKRLQQIGNKLSEVRPDLKYFISLDAQPVMERDLAYRSGLGWFGKNSMLINRRHGSYFIIGSLLLNQKLGLKTAVNDVDHCGQCLACVEACPTSAIDPETRTLKARDCISTFTIEVMKEASPPAGQENSRGEFFGCDICQDVCPWNKKPLQKVGAGLQLVEPFVFLKQLLYETPKEKLLEMIEKESGRSWRKKLSGTPFDRPGRVGWMKNLKALIKN